MIRSAGSAWKSARPQARVPISPSTGISAKPCPSCSATKDQRPRGTRCGPSPAASPSPRRKCRHTQLIALPPPPDILPGVVAQPGTACPEPEDDIGVQQDHGLRTRSGYASASHSTSTGEVMSPRIFSLPRSMPKRVWDFSRQATSLAVGRTFLLELIYPRAAAPLVGGGGPFQPRLIQRHWEGPERATIATGWGEPLECPHVGIPQMFKKRGTAGTPGSAPTAKRTGWPRTAGRSWAETPAG